MVSNARSYCDYCLINQWVRMLVSEEFNSVYLFPCSGRENDNWLPWLLELYGCFDEELFFIAFMNQLLLWEIRFLNIDKNVKVIIFTGQ